MTKSKSPAAPPRQKTAQTIRKSVSLPEPKTAPGTALPIVGIGASAGGLEALEQFLAQVPKKSGLAFVVIQHLDPTRKGLMPELLQRVTDMKVIQAKDRSKTRANCVYVIPPDKDMSILHGVLHLFEPTASRGLRLPIDFFLRSLAQDQEHNSIGVILSGMGSDGTLGLRAIKEKAGLALVQEPESAKFDSMPRSAIDAGLADFVAPAADLPAKIVAYLSSPQLASPPETTVDPKMQSALEKAVILLRSHTAHDFSAYKHNTLFRRIERRMGIHQIPKIAAYVRYLQANPQELDLLFKELLIGVTGFFRDPAAWEALRKKALMELLANRSSGHLRAWVAGCSTGEEAYSLAIALKEASAALKPSKRFKIQIFASDLDKVAIERARRGLFLSNISADVSPERLRAHFTEEGEGYRVCHDIREMVVFSPHSLIMDPPFTKLDILSCRNLLIYLTPEMQKKLFPIFHYSLNPGGILFLGTSETIGSYTHLFETIDSKSRIFRRANSALRATPIDFPSSFAASAPHQAGAGRRKDAKPIQSLQERVEQIILQRYAPATVLVDDKGNILHISGRTGKYLEPAAGKANWNIFAMARDGLRYELSAGFQKALRSDSPVTMRRLKIDDGPTTRFADVVIEKLRSRDELDGTVIIAFTEVPAPEEAKAPLDRDADAPESQRLAEAEASAHQFLTELQRAREEMQFSQEELRSANEELQSTNEEMQSTNEELTTSKEEMQSLNEELQTVNAELQGKVDELSRSSNDMKNLLNSTDVATLFLDNDLKVRRFTTPTTKIIKLIPGDIGRPITDLASDLFYPDLPADARDTLRKLVSTDKSVKASDGRWFTARIMPYRTLDNRIDGVVITFWDISEAKKLEAALLKAQSKLESRLAKQSIKTDDAKAALSDERAKTHKRKSQPSAAELSP